MKLTTLKGMQDILPSDMPSWQDAEHTLTRISTAYGFEEIRTPILEPLELFSRSVGDHTDIVQKEMFSFTDQGGTKMCARPEATASVMRSYLEHHMDQQKPLSRLYYIGPLFRHERPQKGRFRQFYQFGIETIGKRSPVLDAEMIVMAYEIATAFGIEDFDIQINSLGDQASRNAYRSLLQDHFEKGKADMSDHERIRLQENPLRLLDSKNPKLESLIQDAPSILDHLSDDARGFFDQVIETLETSKVPVSINPRIVRGMDYYCDTAFELVAKGLGSQSTVIGGGRYDGLASQLGGADTPATGFALGLERLLMVSTKTLSTPSKSVVLFGLDPSHEALLLSLATQIRRANPAIKVHHLPQVSSLKSGLRAANKFEATDVLVLGSNEYEKQCLMWKQFASQEQTSIAWEKLDQPMETWT